MNSFLSCIALSLLFFNAPSFCQISSDIFYEDPSINLDSTSTNDKPRFQALERNNLARKHYRYTDRTVTNGQVFMVDNDNNLISYWLSWGTESLQEQSKRKIARKSYCSRSKCYHFTLDNNHGHMIGFPMIDKNVERDDDQIQGYAPCDCGHCK